jgi:L-lysine exporter family protein LysE/ArgO
MHYLIFGIILGIGVAIPIGPVNLEMIRRNLYYGTSYGIMLGLGACSADITYLILLCAGALTLLQYPDVLRSVGILGSFVLLWFSYKAFTAKVAGFNEQSSMPSLVKYGIEGYLITLVNPYTILFWGSVSSQISMIAIDHNPNAIWETGIGVTAGTVGWVLIINAILHFTRHKLNEKMMKLLNMSGGVILLVFAVIGFTRALSFN